MTALLDVRDAASPVTPAAAERGSTFRRRIAAASIIGAGGVSLAGWLATPWENHAGTAAYLRALAAHPRQAMIAATILHFGYLLLVPTAFVLARLARRGAPKLAGAGLALAVVGSGLSGLVSTDAYDLSIARHLGPVAGAPVSEMSHVPGATIGMVGMAVTSSFGMIIGLVLLALAVWRARLAPVWPAVAILVGFLGAFGAHSMVRACSTFALVAVAIAFLGIKVLRLGDARFERGADRR